MDDPYNTGYNQGCGYRNGGRSLGVNTNMLDNIQLLQQQPTLTGQGGSTTIRERNDSFMSQVSPRALQVPPARHQAEQQPCGQQLILQTGAALSFQAPAMSRGASFASHHSSTSSGQRYGREANFHQSFPNMHLPGGVNMQRSRSTYSPNGALCGLDASPQSGIPRIRPSSFHDYNSNFESTRRISNTTHDGSMDIPLNEVIIDYDWNGLDGVGHVGSGAIGHDFSE